MTAKATKLQITLQIKYDEVKEMHVEFEYTFW